MQKGSSLYALHIRHNLRVALIPNIHTRRRSDNTSRNRTDSIMADFVDKAEELDIGLEERASRGSIQGRGDREGRGSKRFVGGGGSRREMNREVTISKALSRLLRHAAPEAGLKLDAEGFASVEQVVSSTLFLLAANTVHVPGSGHCNIVESCIT